MPSKLTVIGIVAMVVAAAVGAYILFFSEQVSGKEYNVKFSDFVFVLEDGNWPLRVKVGQKIVFKCKNVGGYPHEMMIVTPEAKDALLQMAKGILNDLASQGLTGDELAERYEEVLADHEAEDGVLAEIILEPGESGDISVVFTEPGTYYVICLEADGTADGLKVHAEHGMIAEIIVEA